MAYDPDVYAPALQSQGIGGEGGREWNYRSADALTTVRAPGYFTDGYERGMRAGDVVKVVNTATNGVTHCGISSDANEVIDLSDGVGAGGNTD